MIPAAPATFSRNGLEAADFEGRQTWEQLRGNDLADPPLGPAAYLVLRTSARPPRFLEANPEGASRAKDPSVPITTL
jgi:hypothetical protein